MKHDGLPKALYTRSPAKRKRRRRQDALSARAINARYQLSRMRFPGSVSHPAAQALANQLYKLACLDGQYWNGRAWTKHMRESQERQRGPQQLHLSADLAPRVALP